MSSKRPSRPGDRPGPTPGPDANRSVPLPMVTQPMAAVTNEDALRAAVAHAEGGRHHAEPPRHRGAHGHDDFSRPTVMDANVAAAAAMVRANSPRAEAILSAAGMSGTTVVSPSALASTGSASLAPISGAAATARQAPEIGLTQHHLPDDVPLDARLVLVHDSDSDRAAAYRVLRHHLLEAGRPQVVVVASPRPEEGKTTVAVNLALALSECGRAKVLLVETNVRRPQLAEVFQFTPPWCFAEQLAAHRHQPMLPWGFVDIPQVWLHVAAINPRIEQNQLLDAPAFAIAMDRLRLGGYDHIVIDSPSVLGSADVNLIQDASDGVVLALRGRTSTARDLRLAVDQLSPSKILGSVLLEH